MDRRANALRSPYRVAREADGKRVRRWVYAHKACDARVRSIARIRRVPECRGFGIDAITAPIGCLVSASLRIGFEEVGT